MFNQIYTNLSAFISLSNKTEYSKDDKSTISKMSYRQFQKILTLINDQKPIHDREYALYKLNYTNFDFEMVSVVLNNEPNEFHTTFDTTDTHLILNTLSPQYLINYLLDNQKSRYIILPLNYGSNLSESGHIAPLIFDNQNKKVYMLDPNGKSTFFNSVLDFDTNVYVECMLIKYLNQLSDLGLKYTFMCSKTWNQKNICINKNFKNSPIGSGHCVILTLMLAHLLITNKCHPSIIYDMFKHLTDDEVLFLIKEYSLGIHNLLGVK